MSGDHFARLRRLFLAAEREFPGLRYAVLRYVRPLEAGNLTFDPEPWPESQEGDWGGDALDGPVCWPWRADPQGATLGATDAEWRRVAPSPGHHALPRRVATTRDFLVLGGRMWQGSFVVDSPGSEPGAESEVVDRWNLSLAKAIQRFEELASRVILLRPEIGCDDTYHGGLIVRENPADRWLEVLFESLRPAIRSMPRPEREFDARREPQSTVAYALLPTDVFSASEVVLGRLCEHANAVTVVAPIAGGAPTNTAEAVPVATSAGVTHEDAAMTRVMSLFTRGVTDERARQTEAIVANDTLSVNEKLLELMKVVPHLASQSSRSLGKLLDCSQQAVAKTPWWKSHGRGRDDEAIARRVDVLKDRADQELGPRSNRARVPHNRKKD